MRLFLSLIVALVLASAADAGCGSARAPRARLFSGGLFNRHADTSSCATPAASAKVSAAACTGLVCPAP